MNDGDYYLLGDVSRILRRPPHQIVYLLTTRQVPEPAVRLGNRRLFTIHDIHRLAEILGMQLPQDESGRTGGSNG